MSEVKIGLRDQVKALIQEGVHTKAEIADLLDTKPANISSQMTYLRWMGNSILADENKCLRFVEAEEYAAAMAAVAANRKLKGTTSTKSPQERANTMAKTIHRQESTLAKMEAKLNQISDDYDHDPEDPELAEMLAEAEANVVLQRIKLKRNKATAAELPAPEVTTAPVVDTNADVDEDEDEDTEDDDLL